MALTAKQARFVEEYLVDLNATQAAIRAGYSERTAKAIGCENLTKPDVIAAVSAAQDKRTKKVELTQEWVLERLAAEAEDHGEDSTASARIKALELLGKHIGMWPNKVKVEGSVDVEISEVVVRTRAEARAALSTLAEASRVPGLNGHG